MSWTFGDSQDFLSQLLGDSNTSSDDMYPTNQRNRELNNAEVQFAIDALNLKEYETGSVSSSQIAMPSNWIRTYLLIVDDFVLNSNRLISLEDYERYYQYSGNPPYYYYWEFYGTNYIKFFGSATTYKLYYFKRPTTALVNSTDVSIHPEQYRKGIVYFAAAELMKQIGKHQESDKFYNTYLEYVTRARTESGKNYIEKNYASPDFGDIDINSAADRQGQGYPPWGF